MKNIPTIAKLFALLSFITSTIWIGSYFSRLFLVYQLFEGPYLVIKSYITDQNIGGILYSLLPSILVTFISFILMIPAFFLFVITSKLKLRNNGWLFIILIAVIVTLPFEIYLMIIDYKLIMILNGSIINTQQVITLLRDRIKDLSSFPLMIIICYLSFYYFLIFQPLTKITKDEK